MPKVCRNCQKAFDPKEPWHEFCSPECKRDYEQGGASSFGTRTRTQRPQSGRRPPRRQEPSSAGRPAGRGVPDNCIFESFYEGGRIRRGIYLEAAQTITDICMREGLTASQLRQLFHMLKSVEQRLKSEPDLDFGIVREAVWKFARHVTYQVKRGVLESPTFSALVEKHIDLACKDAKEFVGFVEYLTSIVAYLKEK